MVRRPMSAMSRIATYLEIDWAETETGYQHNSGRFAAISRSDQAFDLFTNPTGAINGWSWVMTARLHTIVDFVNREG